MVEQEGWVEVPLKSGPSQRIKGTIESWIDVSTFGVPYEIQLGIYSNRYRHRKHGHWDWIDGHPADIEVR